MALTGVVVDHSLGKSLGIWCAERKRRYQAYGVDIKAFPPETVVDFQLSEDGRLAIDIHKLEESTTGQVPGKPIFGEKAEQETTSLFQVAK